jgi:cell division septum initiation protein DivIVA
MIGSKAEIRPIEQQDITALLDRLKELRQRIAEACVPLTELEYNMVRAHDEFQAAAGYLRQHALRLQAEITTLRARIDEALWNEEEEDEGNGIDYSGRNGGVQEREREDTSITHDPEAEAKEILFRHLYWVLDPDIEDADADLVARLEGMAREPTTRLSDLLQ